MKKEKLPFEFPEGTHDLAAKYVEKLYTDLVKSKSYDDKFELSLILLAQALTLFFNGSEILNRTGLIIDQDKMTINPIVRLISQARVQALNIIEGFGSTQSSGVRLKSKSERNNETKNVLNKILLSGSEDDDE